MLLLLHQESEDCSWKQLILTEIQQEQFMIMGVKLLTEHSIIYLSVYLTNLNKRLSLKALNCYFFRFHLWFELSTHKNSDIFCQPISQEVRKCLLFSYRSILHNLNPTYLKQWYNWLPGHQLPLILSACSLENNLAMYRINSYASLLAWKLQSQGRP